MSKMRFTYSLLIIALSIAAVAQKQTPQQYLDLHKDLAIIEMHRSGVPASITLAQGILESNSGNSRLAKYANNHFGIKCKGEWTGKTISADDDAPDECFRAYDNVLESYQDHSDFLRKNWRYHPLFELSGLDYQGWCNGLQKAGYATNPQYGAILISLIERYNLSQYDEATLPNNGTPTITIGDNINGIPVKTAKPGETLESVANENYVKDRHIRKWNDLPKGAELEPGEIIFLKPKRRSGSEESHVVAKGEDMHAISQLYGIKLKQLYRKNRMEQGTEPKEGEVIYMQKKRDREDEVEVATDKPQWQEKKEQAFVNPHSVPQKVIDSTDFSKPGALNKVKIEVPEYHLVAKGDNIYRIAEKYHVMEEDLLNWNSTLNPSSMSIGQKIYLSQKDADANGTVVKTPVVENKVVPAPKTDKEIEEAVEKIAVNGPVFHHVVKGDTLYNICKRYNITAEQLKEWNKLETINIQLDQKLQVSE